MRRSQTRLNPMQTYPQERPFAGTPSSVKPSNRLVPWIGRHWQLLFAAIMGLYAGLPVLAPAFMQIGWTAAGNAIYTLYAMQCHQLPQRSFFLFGSKTMYSLGEVRSAWQNTLDPLILRQFIGNPEMGWKVAWSDRMVAMYTSIFAFSLLWGLLRRWFKLPRLTWWGLLLLLLPMAFDGTSHFISDLAGIGQGFRDSNAWLAYLTGNRLPPAFYAGDAISSFNSWMRLLSGVSFGLGIVWFAFPYLEELFEGLTAQSHTSSTVES